MTPALLAPVVVDASVSIAWVLQEKPGCLTAQALFLQGYKGQRHLLAPALWLWECGNVLHSYVKRGHLSATDLPDVLRVFRYPRIVFDEMPDIATQVATLHVAAQWGLSYYDAAYVELAQRRKAQLATYDEKMQAVARNIGIACYDLT